MKLGIFQKLMAPSDDAGSAGGAQGAQSPADDPELGQSEFSSRDLDDMFGAIQGGIYNRNRQGQGQDNNQPGERASGGQSGSSDDPEGQGGQDGSQAEGENGEADREGKESPAPSQNSEGAGNGEPESGQQAETRESAGDESLREQLKALREQNQTLSEILRNQQQQSGQQQPQGQRQRDPLEGVPAYAVNIPDNVLEMVDSDEPGKRKEGLGILLRGMGRMVHAGVRQEMEQRLNNLRQELPTTVQQTVQNSTTADSIRKDYFGKYPEHNNPALVGAIQHFASEAMQELSARGWNEQVRDRIGQKTDQLLGIKRDKNGKVVSATGGTASQPPGPQRQSPPSGQRNGPPRQSPPGAGGGTSRKPGSDPSQEIKDIVFG